MYEHFGIDGRVFARAQLHQYIDRSDGSRVLDVTEGRDESACDKLTELTEEQLKDKSDRHGCVAAYIKAAESHVPDADVCMTTSLNST